MLCKEKIRNMNRTSRQSLDGTFYSGERKITQENGVCFLSMLVSYPANMSDS